MGDMDSRLLTVIKSETGLWVILLSFGPYCFQHHVYIPFLLRNRMLRKRKKKKVGLTFLALVSSMKRCQLRGHGRATEAPPRARLQRRPGAGL